MPDFSVFKRYSQKSITDAKKAGMEIGSRILATRYDKKNDAPEIRQNADRVTSGIYYFLANARAAFMVGLDEGLSKGMDFESVLSQTSNESWIGPGKTGPGHVRRLDHMQADWQLKSKVFFPRYAENRFATSKGVITIPVCKAEITGSTSESIGYSMVQSESDSSSISMYYGAGIAIGSGVPSGPVTVLSLGGSLSAGFRVTSSRTKSISYAFRSGVSVTFKRMTIARAAVLISPNGPELVREFGVRLMRQDVSGSQGTFWPNRNIWDGKELRGIMEAKAARALEAMKLETAEAIIRTEAVRLRASSTADRLRGEHAF